MLIASMMHLRVVASDRRERSPSSLKCFHVQLRRDLAEAKHYMYLAKAGNLFDFKEIASSSLRNTPPRNDTKCYLHNVLYPLNKYNKSGSILIMALWTLGFLSLLAASLGVGVRQRITFLSRLESRDNLQLIAESGISRAIAVLNQDIERSGAQFTAEVKAFRFHNEKEFASLNLRDGTVEVSYEYNDRPGALAEKRFGMVDEESKLNMNTATEIVLRGLIKNVLGLDDAHAHDLAQAMVDWREYTEGETKGFYSESYYENLEDSYPVKKANFEIIDELLLVQGIDPPTFKRLSPYLTVYGNGRVNINTASRPVLIALGMEEELADKVLSARRGKDGIEATADDYIFQKTYDIASELKGFAALSDAEVAMIDQLNQQGKFDTNSRHYSIRAQGKLNNSTSKIITCVFNTAESKIEYWKED